MSSIGGFLSGIFGGQTNYQANVNAPDRSLFVNPDAENNRAMLQQSLAQAAAGRAPTATAADIDQAQQAQFRGMQSGLANQLQATASGQGPSLASMQLQQGLQQQLAAQRAQAASVGSDVNPAIAQRQLAMQAAAAMQATNAQAAQARTAEQIAAQQSLGGLLGQSRSQDVELAAQQAAMRQQAGLANQQAAMQQAQLNQAGQQFALGGLLNQSEANRQAMMQYANTDLQRQLGNQQINAGTAQANAAAAGRYGSAVFGGLAQGGAALLSDERAKTNVDRGGLDADMREFLGGLDPASYDYKNRSHGEGRHWSVMAQSAARSKAGRSFVGQRPDGMMDLDTRKATGVALAALAHLHRRQERTESLAEKVLNRHG